MYSDAVMHTSSFLIINNSYTFKKTYYFFYNISSCVCAVSNLTRKLQWNEDTGTLQILQESPGSVNQVRWVPKWMERNVERLPQG